MLLFDATHHSLRPVVAQLQQAGRKERGAALYNDCLIALERARSMGDDAAFVLIAQTFALVLDQDGYSDASIAWLLEAVDCAKRCGEFGEQSHMQYLIGRAYYSRAEYGVALGHWTEGMAIARRDGDRISGCWCKLGMGQICDALDAPDIAVKLFSDLERELENFTAARQRLPLVQRARFDMRLRELKAINTVNLGVNQMRSGKLDAALASLELGHSLAAAAEMQDIANECEVRIAEVHAHQGDCTRALAMLVSVQTALEACAHHWALATLFLLRAQCQSELGQLVEASASIGLARMAADRANAKHIALRIERENARIAEKAGNLAEALVSLKTAATLQDALGRGSATHLLHHLQSLADQRDTGSPVLSPGGRDVLTR